MWHANASASEGWWAGPGVGAAAAGVSTPAAIISEAALAAERASAATALAATAETNEEVESMTTPIFKPFVMVRIPLPSGYTHGEVLGLNNSNQAVGWMHHQSSGKARPFVFDPALISTDPANAVSILDFATDTDSGKAYAISDADPPVIVGSLYYTPEAIDRAASWEVDGDFIAFYYDSETPSAAQGINADERVVGYYQYADEPYSFVIEGANNWNPAAASHSAAHGVNASGKVVGWHEVSAKSHAYSWVSNTTTDINPSGYDYSSALAVNDAGHIGGWVADTDEEEKIAALWNFVIPGVYTVEPFDTGASSAVTAINASGEMAITREDDSGVAIWSKRSGVDHADLLDDVTLMPGGSDVLNSARAINDNGWIGGSYLAGGTGNPQPCLIIPYDVDNNGTPDYREILEGKREGHTDLDTDGNWLLDWAEHIDGEGMRVGLHAPDGTAYARAIENTQVIRSPVHLRNLYFDSGDPLNFPIEEILDDPTTCHDFTEYLNNWTSDTVKREAIIWLRSSLIDDDVQYDYLPQSSEQRTELLGLIREFGHRYATCIDYIQTGNEVFGGAGGYKFYETDLPQCNESWSGAITFQQVHPDCKAEAAGAVLLWLHDQMWAALEGSALAGRPLRMIGPGIPSAVVDGGFEGAGVSRSLMQLLVPWLNERQMYFDLHNHYLTVSGGTTVIRRLMDEVQGSTAPWDAVERAVCLELAPRVTIGSTWADANEVKFDDFVDPQCPDPGTNWWDFVLSWRFADFSDDFEIDTLLSTMAAPGGNSVKAFSAVCYNHGQLDPPDFRFDMAALRATQICVTYIGNNQGASRYTPIKGDYESAAAAYNIANFDPHPDECGGCPQQ